MKKVLKGLVVAGAAVSMAACSTYSVDRYAVNVDSVSALRDMEGTRVAVGEFQSEKPIKRIMCRGAGPVAAPEGMSFSQYVGGALKDELRLAEIYADDAPVTLSGGLTRAEFSSVGGMWTLDLDVTSSNGRTLSVSEAHDFDTSFSADAACGDSAGAFMPAVQDLIHKLVTDPEFQALVDY